MSTPAERLIELSRLKPGWVQSRTGPDGEAISAECIAIAAAILASYPTNGIYPTPDGGVQLEWYNTAKSASVELYIHTDEYHGLGQDNGSEEDDLIGVPLASSDIAHRWLAEHLRRLNSGPPPHQNVEETTP